MFWKAALVFVIPLLTIISAYLAVANGSESVDLLLGIFTFGVLCAASVAASSMLYSRTQR